MTARACVRIVAKAFALAFVFFSLLGGKTFAATDWSAIQSALDANGTEMPGDVLRFELIRQDLTITVNGTTLPVVVNGAVANGFVAFKPAHDGSFFVDGSLPAQESEVAALQTALRANTRIHIASIASNLILETPKLIWIRFEATGSGADLATSLASALTAIHSPQLNVTVIPGTDNVFNPSSILPPKFLKLYDEGFVEQLGDTFAFYLPRPDENRILLGDVSAESGLGIGQSFHIQVSFSGGTSVTLDIDFCLRSDELQPIEDTLRAGGFTITSQTNAFLGDNPSLYFVHATASGDGFGLGNTLYDVVQMIKAGSVHHGY